MTYEPDDYIKAEIVDEASKESEWLWVRVDRCDDQERLIFGTLDNIPALDRWPFEPRVAVFPCPDPIP